MEGSVTDQGKEKAFWGGHTERKREDHFVRKTQRAEKKNTGEEGNQKTTKKAKGGEKREQEGGGKGEKKK